MKNLDTLVAGVRSLVELVKSIKGFSIPEDIRAQIVALSALIRENNETEALASATLIDQSLRAKVGGFLHFSVTDRVVDEKTRVARFNQELFRRKQQDYDKDLLNRMSELIGKMVRAVNDEKGNADFSLRIAAYNATCKVVEEVDKEQELRRTKKPKKATGSKLARQQQEALAATERNKARDAAAREARLANRVKLADELASMIA